MSSDENDNEKEIENYNNNNQNLDELAKLTNFTPGQIANFHKYFRKNYDLINFFNLINIIYFYLILFLSNF